MSLLSTPAPTLLLRARLALGRAGWTSLLAGALFIAGAAAFLIGLPTLQTRVDARQADLAQVTARVARAGRQPRPAAAPLPPAQRNLQAFYDALGDVRYVDQDVAVILDEADRQGLTIAQADYKLGYEKNGLYHVYTMQMPVTGSYAAIRAFCRQVLLSLPYAALEEISVKRAAIGDATVEARLRLALYLDGPADYAPGKAVDGGAR
ncbi:hypothetical protein [Nitrospirillum viridazoti]|uniref:Type II secretion system (T2SS) protein M subtype b n=1 Tax=Nitrospirillum amazonense TaxID=28077 RepID=A0A560IZV8_9PROT|nr:hypothetical protein [Nitrospirillum amazonense]TWB64025.1 hypothetical protein FBZ92_102203 [Nitrospirillum amazonense]